jgi:hypothetical protein
MKIDALPGLSPSAGDVHRYRVTMLERQTCPNRIIVLVEESHSMPYFFPSSLDLPLESNGFRCARKDAA